MSSRNLKVVTAAQMARLEQEAERRGTGADTLIEQAGLSAAQAARRRLGAVAGAPVAVLVGPGNNGADGLAAARHLRRWGAEVTVCLLTGRPAPDPMLARARQYGVREVNMAEEGLSALPALLDRSRLVIDAVLGTGRSRPLSGRVQEAMLQLGRRPRQPGRCLKLALDLPTGLDADTGAVDPATPVMDATLALGRPKVGLLTFPGAGRAGELETLDIGLPANLGEADIALELLSREWVGEHLPPRPPEAHKGTFGHLLLVAGSRRYVGAACLAARAAARTGAGLVTLATPQSIYPMAAAQLTETIHLPLPEDADGGFCQEAAVILRETLHRYDCLALGCGLGQSAGAGEFLQHLLLAGRSVNIPTLIDADGLNLLARLPHWWRRRSGPLVLTPHPGEMAALTGLAIQEVQNDRVAAARQWAARWQAVVTLKGAFTAIAEPGPEDDAKAAGLVRLAPFANPALASGGTGDVLTGIIGGLLAQGRPPLEAASCGVFLHGWAAAALRRAGGSAGLVASDLPDCLPRAMSLLRPDG